MGLVKTVLAVIGFGVVCAVILGQVFYRLDIRAAESAWDGLRPQAAPAPPTFDPSMVAELPEPARRYLAYSIAPGTPLKTTVELEMTGRFGLGDKESHRIMPMRARQILSPPHGFVWIANIGSGLMRFSGSDGYASGEAWTRFWLLATIPIVRSSATPDLARSAAARSIMEAIWAPASLLPANGAGWEQVDENAARVTFEVNGEPLSMTLTLSPEGRPLTVEMMRWSDANPDKVFRWQLFGGSIEEVGPFEGYTIPTRVHVGNHFGTAQYFPFFQARIVSARYR